MEKLALLFQRFICWQISAVPEEQLFSVRTENGGGEEYDFMAEVI